MSLYITKPICNEKFLKNCLSTFKTKFMPRRASHDFHLPAVAIGRETGFVVRNDGSRPRDSGGSNKHSHSCVCVCFFFCLHLSNMQQWIGRHFFRLFEGFGVLNVERLCREYGLVHYRWVSRPDLAGRRHPLRGKGEVTWSAGDLVQMLSVLEREPRRVGKKQVDRRNDR